MAISENVKSFVHVFFGELGIVSRWIVIIIVFAAVIGLACLFDKHTGWSYYRGLDSQVELLEQLHELSIEGIEKSSTLKSVYLSIVDQVIHSRDRVGISRISSTQEKNPYLTTISSSIFGLFVLLGSLFVGKKKRKAAALAGVVLVLFFGAVGWMLPIIIHPAVNYTLMLLLQTIILIPAARAFSRTKNMAKEAACKSYMRSLATGVHIYKAKEKVLPDSLADISKVMRQATQLKCPSCNKVYTYQHEDGQYEINCPNVPSHGSIKNGKTSW